MIPVISYTLRKISFALVLYNSLFICKTTEHTNIHTHIHTLKVSLFIKTCATFWRFNTHEIRSCVDKQIFNCTLLRFFNEWLILPLPQLLVCYLLLNSTYFSSLNKNNLPVHSTPTLSNVIQNTAIYRTIVLKDISARKIKFTAIIFYNHKKFLTRGSYSNIQLVSFCLVTSLINSGDRYY